MAVSEDDIRRVARLARLELTDEEVCRLTPQIAAIIGFVEQLNELETAAIAPLTQAIESSNVLVDDVVRPGLTREAVLANAPKHDDECFLVPPVLGGVVHS